MIEPLIIKCPKCGNINRASAMNCEYCHININWALENQASFEVDDKSEQQVNLQPSHAPSIGQTSLPLRNNLGPVIFIMVFILIIVFSAKTDWLCTLPMLLAFGALFWFTRTYERNLKKELEEIWSELGRQTGLTYVPSKRSFLGYNSPSVRGEYRGIYLSIDYVIEGGGGEYDAPRGFTRITLLIRNHARFSLEINETWIPIRRYRKHAVISGNDEFDRHFQVKGTPREFAYRAIRLTDLQSILLSDKSQSKIMKNPYALSWASSCGLSIKLDGSDLVCLIHGVYKFVHTQTAMLNMLCDLAELAEQMGSESASSATRRN